jgi:hypothetical protein
MRIAHALLTASLAACLGASCTPRQSASGAAATPAVACLPGERGYLRASLRGALDAELDWRGDALQCEGGARPDRRGLRVSFAGPADAQGRQLRLVFGIAAPPGVNAGRTPTNVTVIIEGQGRLYATQGDDKCTIESLVQEPVPLAALPEPTQQPPATPNPAAQLPVSTHLYRVAARGYCIDPAATLDGSGHLYINRFDFAGSAHFEDDELHADRPRT